MLQTFLITWVTHNSRVSERMKLYEEVIIAHREEKPELLGDGEPVQLSSADEVTIAGYLGEIIREEGLQILAMNICQDHVHMVIVCEEMELTSIVRKMKSISSRKYNIAHGFTVSDKGACSLAQEYDNKSAPSQFKGASPLVEARGKSQSQLWAQKFNTVVLTDEQAVQNACHYVYYNRQKHGLSENLELQKIIRGFLTHSDDVMKVRGHGLLSVLETREHAPLSVSDWLSTPSTKPKLLVIYGPTACGKTDLTVELALKHNGKVVMADSRQIYRGMNIGTGKITQKEMQGVPHHMLDIRDISELYGVGEFAPEARRIIAEIHARGKLPILSGGTGLFIDSVVGNFTIPEVKADWEYRDELERFRLEEGNNALWEKLNAVDPEYAAELDPRNYRYVIRGLEIWKATGQSKKVLGQKTESPYDFLRITPFDGDREKLYERINRRVEKMFQDGLIEEVQSLLASNKVDPKLGIPDILEQLPGLNAIGYREIFPYLAGESSLEKTLELVQQNSRHYAKRQLTWFRRYADD